MGLLDRLRAEDEGAKPLSLLEKLRLGDAGADDEGERKRRAREAFARRQAELAAAGALPTDEAAPEQRTAGDYLRRLGAAALSGPGDYVALKETVVRALTPESMEASMTRALVPERAALEAAQGVVPGLALTPERLAEERERFRAKEGSGLVAAALGPGAAALERAIPGFTDAAIDTTLEGAGALLDPTNLIPTGAAVRGVTRVAPRGAARIAGALDNVATRLEGDIPAVLDRTADVGRELVERAQAPRMSQATVPPRPLSPPPLVDTPKPRVYREVGLDDAMSFIDSNTDVDMTSRDVFVAESPDMALGQGGNTGILLEMDPSSLRLRQATHKPGLALTGGELVGRYNTQRQYRDAVTAIHIKPGQLGNSVPLRQRLANHVLPRLERQGWTREVADDGTITLRRPTSANESLPPELAGSIPGSPEAAGPPIVTPPFQTNLAAQTDGAEVAAYIVARSDEIAAKAGPPVGWDETEAMALRLGTTKEEFLARSPRYAQMSKEERLRLAMVVKGNEDDISGLQARLAAGQATADEQADLLRLIDQRGQLIKLAVSSGSEFGRALNSLKIQARASLGESALAREALYRRYRQQVDKDPGMLNALARLDPSNQDEVQTFLRAVDQPRLRDYVTEYWLSSILSGPATHFRNLIGNTANAFAENLMVRPVRAALDPIVAARQGREQAHYMAEAPAAAYGLGAGLFDGLRKGLHVLRTGYDTSTSKLLPPRSAFARSNNRVVREMVGPVVTAPLRLLAASDAVFKTMNYSAELYAQAANVAAREGRSGSAMAARVAELVATPTPEMADAATKFALKATFNDDVSEIGRAWMSLRDKVPVVGTFLSPFVKIVDRLMVRGFEYTPVGAIKAVRAPAGSAQVSDLAARSSIGSAVILGAVTLAISDRITASAPTDPGERDAFYRAGKKPWAVRMPLPSAQWLVERGVLPGEAVANEVPNGDGDVWIPYAQMQPLSTPLALTASWFHGWRENGEEPTLDKISAAAVEVGKYVTDQSFMSSLSDALAAVGGRGSYQQSVSAASSVATQVVGGMVPFSGLSRSISQAVDPRLVDVRSIGDKVQSTIPGGSLGLPARLDVWGEEIVPATGRLRGLAATGTPLDASVQDTNPLDAELQRIGVNLGFVDRRVFDPRVNKQVKLSPQEYYRYQQTAGRETRSMLSELFADPDYQSADAEAQREIVEDTIGAARQYARMVLLYGEP